jgi:colicin import membrane protein
VTDDEQTAAAQTGEVSSGSTGDEAKADQVAHQTAHDAELARSQARGEELRSEVAITDARRAEEEAAKAHKQPEAAEQSEEKLNRRQQRAKERAQAAEEQAEAARERAGEAAEAREEAESHAGRPAASVSGANVAAPGIGTNTDPGAAAAAARDSTASRAAASSAPAAAGSDRPEVMIGAAFAGSFVLARILKRIFD